MSSIHTQLKDCFKKLIEANLTTDNELSKNFMLPYRQNLKSHLKDLKFYKYVNTEYYSIRNLEANQLGFKLYSEFNDAFEGIPAFSKIGELNQSTIIRDSAAITCFCEKPNELLMFAHYADSYKGMCIEYDFSMLNDRLVDFFFPVIYEVSPAKLEGTRGLGDRVTKHIDVAKKGCISLDKLYDITSYFVRKPSVWSYECEWRFVVTADQYNNVFNDEYKEGKKIYTLKDFDCISKVFFGIKMDSIKKDHILEIIEKKNNGRPSDKKIEVFSTVLDGNVYKLNCEKL